MQLLKRKLPCKKDKPEEVCTKIRDLITVSENFRSSLFCGNGLEHKLRGDYRSYRGFTTGTADEVQSRFSVKMVFSFVRAILAELMGKPPVPKIRGKRFSTMIHAEIVNEYLKKQFELGGSFKAWRDATILNILHGTSIVRKDWIQKVYEYEKWVPDLLIDEEIDLVLPTYTKEKLKDIAYEGWKDSNVNLLNFFWDPYGTDMESCSWVCEIDRYFTIDDIQKYLDMGLFSVSSKDMKEIQESELGGMNFKKERYNDDFQTSDAHSSDNIPTFPLIRYYTDEEIFYVLVFGENSFLLMNKQKDLQVNPFQMKHNHRKPYIKNTFWPLPGEFLGLGIGDMANEYQYYASRAAQMEIDQLKMNLMRKFIIRKNAVVNDNHLLDDSNLIVWVRDMDGIRDLPPVPSMGSGINMMQTIQKAAEEDLGINKIMQGNRLGGEVSATEAAEVASMGRKQLTVPFNNVMDSLREHFKMSCCFNYLFLEPDYMFYLGKELEIKYDMFDTMNLEIDVDEHSVSVNSEGLWQKKIEVMAQALEPHIPFGYINPKAIDAARVAAAGLDPRDFIKMDGQPAFSLEDEMAMRVAQQFVTAVQGTTASNAMTGNPTGIPPGPGMPLEAGQTQESNVNALTSGAAPSTQMGDMLKQL